jgi:hypothetical protein
MLNEMGNKFCMHTMSLVNGKLYESISVVDNRFANPFPWSKFSNWSGPVAKIGGHEVQYGYSVWNKTLLSDLYVTHFIRAVAVEHELGKEYSKDVCRHIKTAWSQAKNFVHFMVLLDMDPEDREKMLRELADGYPGIIDLDEVSSRHPLKVRALKKNPMMRVVGHYLYTLEPVGDIKCNRDYFGIKTKATWGQYA